MAFVWLLLAMMLAGASVPAAILVFAKLGWAEPFSVVAFGRRWQIEPWSRRTVYKASFAPLHSSATVHTGSDGVVAAAVVTVFCVQILVNAPQISDSNGPYFSSSSGVTKTDLPVLDG